MISSELLTCRGEDIKARYENKDKQVSTTALIAGEKTDSESDTSRNEWILLSKLQYSTPVRED